MLNWLKAIVTAIVITCVLTAMVTGFITLVVMLFVALGPHNTLVYGALTLAIVFIGALAYRLKQDVFNKTPKEKEDENE